MDAELPETWDQMPADVGDAISAVLDNGQMPSRALALYARWWQLETWLRSLTYVELRAMFGRAWSAELDQTTLNRQAKDVSYQYMASPDWDDPLAYLDARKLFDVIGRHRTLFDYALPNRETWDGRTAELLSIRNRIGHLRRPHRDDLPKLEQTLRDLEFGAVRAIGSYNRHIPLSRASARNAVVRAIREDRLTDAQGLIEHAEKRYDFGVRVSLTIRPWAELDLSGSISPRQSGVLWNIGVYGRRQAFNRRKLWRELSPLTRQCLIHLLSGDDSHFEVTFPGVEDTKLLKIALGDVLQAALASAVTRRDDSGSYDGLQSYASMNMDSRVQLHTVWALLDEDLPSVSVFASGGGVRQ